MTTMAVAASGLRRLGAEGVNGNEVAVPVQVGRLSRGQTAAVVLSVGLGVVMAGNGLVGSYLTISELAERHDVPLAWLLPAGIDGGLVAVVLLDLVLTWISSPAGWLRQLVRVLSVGTVVVNVVAGWPDPIAVGLHAAVPLMLPAAARCCAGLGRHAVRGGSRFRLFGGCWRRGGPCCCGAGWRCGKSPATELLSTRNSSCGGRSPCCRPVTDDVGGGTLRPIWCGCCVPVSTWARHVNKFVPWPTPLTT